MFASMIKSSLMCVSRHKKLITFSEQSFIRRIGVKMKIAAYHSQILVR